MDEKLNKFRQEIDTIDNQLLELVANRISIMKQIGEAKKELHRPIRDQAREAEKLAIIEKKAQALEVSPQLLTTIWKLFFNFSEEIEK